MIIITGGAYQGKTSYAVQNFNISEDDITDGKICAPETTMTARRTLLFIHYNNDFVICIYK